MGQDGLPLWVGAIIAGGIVGACIVAGAAILGVLSMAG
jgi:hypothetical protein